MQPFGHNKTRAENWGLCPFLGREELGVYCVEAYLHTKWHLHPSSRLATTDMGRKLGVLPPFCGGELDPHLTLCHLGRSLPSYEVAS